MVSRRSCSCWGWSMSLLLCFVISTTSAQNPTISGGAGSLTDKPKFSPFRPTMAVMVGAVTATFSVTFLVLLYARHCKSNSAGGGGGGGADLYRSDQYYHYSSVGRKNSGINRAVVESLPVFRFGAARQAQDGLECAVCLSKFERSEVLRLLPKCRHAFHVECVDTWLDAHSSCPLCRFRVDPEDVLLVVDASRALLPGLQPPPPTNHQRVPGRHSSAGEVRRLSIDSWRQWRRNKRDSSRKDGLLLSQSAGTRSGAGKRDHRWSDVLPSDLTYLRSEMVTSDNSRRFSSGSRPLLGHGKRQQHGTGNVVDAGIDDDATGGSGRVVITSRSVSEITGMTRFSNDNNMAKNDTNHHQHQHQHTEGFSPMATEEERVQLNIMGPRDDDVS